MRLHRTSTPRSDQVLPGIPADPFGGRRPEHPDVRPEGRGGPDDHHQSGPVLRQRKRGFPGKPVHHGPEEPGRERRRLAERPEGREDRSTSASTPSCPASSIATPIFSSWKRSAGREAGSPRRASPPSFLKAMRSGPSTARPGPRPFSRPASPRSRTSATADSSPISPCGGPSRTGASPAAG